MNGDLIITSILFIVSGLPFLACGYLIAIEKKTSIIAGWDENNFNDPESYARVFGWTAILCGLFLAGSAYIYSANVISIYVFIGTIVMAVIVQLLAAGYCSKRYGT
jgi:hypothetical protein